MSLDPLLLDLTNLSALQPSLRHLTDAELLNHADPVTELERLLLDRLEPLLDEAERADQLEQGLHEAIADLESVGRYGLGDLIEMWELHITRVIDSDASYVAMFERELQQLQQRVASSVEQFTSDYCS